MKYVTRPLTDEARARIKTVNREHSRFDTRWGQTLRDLRRELEHLGVRDEFVMQIDVVTDRDLRLDGELRAGARPASPSVAVAFETKHHGPMLFVCGKFYFWQDNVRAIALGLESLRRVERYGIVQSDEQYRGWQALPPGTPMPAAQMSVDEAIRLLHAHAPDVVWDYDDPKEVHRAWRVASLKVHPDVGGDPEMFRKLTEARDLLVEQGTP